MKASAGARRGSARSDRRGGGAVHVKLLGRVAFSCLLIAAIVWRVGVERLAAALRDVAPQWLLFAVVLVPPRLVAKAARWRMLIGQAAKLNWGAAWRSMLIGIAGGTVTPGRVGQISAAFFIRGGDRVGVGSMVLADLGTDVVAAALAAIPAAAYLWGGSVPAWSLLAAGALVAVSAFGPKLAGWLAAGRKAGFITRLLIPIASLPPRRLFAALGLALVVLGFNTVQLYLVVRAFQGVPLVAAAVSCPLILLALVLPITVAGFGVREGAAVAVLGRFGVSPPVAVEGSFLLFVMNTAIPALLGAVLLWHIRREGGT